MKSPQTALLFTDGACSGNPGPGGFGAIALDQNQMVKELGGASPSTTNNQMELLAVIEGLEWLFLKKPPAVSIWTDSKYVIQGITAWVFSWQRNNWMTAGGTPVVNQDYWMRLLKAVEKFPRGSLSWNYVPGHQGIPGNERCDEIAVQYSQGQHPFLYDGPVGGYSVSLEVPDLTTLPQKKSKKSSSEKGLTYLSLVNGQVRRHKDWKSCEALVKGRPGAKFKKSTKSLTEDEILKSWGLNPVGTSIKED